MEQTSKKENLIIKILNILIIITTIPLIIIAFAIGYSIIDELDTGYDENSLHYEFMRSDYPGILNEYSRGVRYKTNDKEETKEYYSVAKYFESASLYKAHVEYGNIELANFFKEKMNEYEKGMGELSVAKKDIFEKLELNEK